MGFCFIQIMSNSDLYNIYLKNPQICTDSRNIKSGGIFFALSGEHFNGNKFALEAINKGCSFAVIDDKRYNSKPNTILVENVLKTLQDLAKIHREKLTIPVIGITGTNGKTTSYWCSIKYSRNK
jgi:UDP-N-acetylmuramoyl-tripeptide--D-alanyl-D-alanine ligase